MASKNAKEWTLVALLFSSVGFWAHASESRILAPLEIGGVGLGMSREAVEKRLGTPISRTASDGFINLRMTYPTLAVGLDEDGFVAELESRSKDACLLHRICPVSSLKAMQEELESGRFMFSVTGDVLEINGDGCWAEVRLSRGRAKSVIILCSP